ncbi:MAG: Xaa-Pro peptidase family protein [candidate division Zixibacteria bacterium]|nr:Xaa-Pro peptidase family protein [candidate division Zixibacteria bacterium]MDH3936293.1 Xaa-Pro peptidase family protein [candidate division Zixibacteria bacterium]MDH4034705.1 Xaa-Pro peptidase family protein [candidate division Zixibacteria bacterium]
MSQKRIAALRKQFMKENLDGMVVTRLDHVFYLCGYTGSNGLLVVTNKTATFLTDFRYTDQAKKEVRGAKVHVMSKGDLVACLPEFTHLMKKNLKLGVSGEHLSVSGQAKLASALPNSLIVSADSVLAELGWVKDAHEIKQIAKAAQIGDVAWGRVLGLLKPGVREREIAAELEYQMKMLGSTKPAFDSIVASGYRSAMPHGEASDKKIAKGDFVTFDFGAVVNRYVSDMTRTVVVGKATARQKKIYNIVLKAQKAGVAKIKAGVKAQAIDEACRKIITRAGYGKEFGHGTGHGIGVYFDPIHSGPRLSTISDDKLKVNNVITVEPGIYISGWGGVRIEDDVVVTRTGGRVLTESPKYLLEL